MRLLVSRTLVVVGDGDDLADLARAHGADVFTGGTGAEALRAAHTATGRIDFVVSAGGVPPTGPLAEAADEAVEEALRAAYLAPVRTARAAFPHLAATKGHLLFHTAGRGDDSLRSAASAAVADLTRALAQEWSEHGVRVSCVNPERPSGPMDVRALAAGPEHTRPSGAEVARTSLDVLLAPFSGRVVDVRRRGPRPSRPGCRGGATCGGRQPVSGIRQRVRTVLRKRGLQALWALPLLLSYPAMLATALGGSTRQFTVAALCNCVADLAAQQYARTPVGLLSRFGLGPAMRSLLRDCMLLVLLNELAEGRHDQSLLSVEVAAVAIVLVHLLNVVYAGSLAIFRARGVPSVGARNISLPAAPNAPRRPAGCPAPGSAASPRSPPSSPAAAWWAP